MSVSLSSLTSRLQSDIPVLNGVPTSDQLADAARDAAYDFSRRASLKRITTLSIVAGTATYALPADFLKVVRLPALSNPSGVFLSGGQLVPIDPTFRERWTVAGQRITFVPTPLYTLDRELTYAAAHVLDEDDAYADMTEEVAAIVLLKARAILQRLLVREATKSAVKRYEQGAVTVELDTDTQIKGLDKSAAADEQQYAAAVARYVGTITMQG